MSQAQTSPKATGTKRDMSVEDSEKHGANAQSSNGDKEREQIHLVVIVQADG